jgi:hypothetical protein
VKVSKPIYRRHDKVRIITPRVFVRCGYPMSLADAREEIAKMRQDDKSIYDFITSFGIGLHYGNTYGKIVNALAYGLLHARGFGGRERTIHTQERPDIKGLVYKVCEKRVVKTGTYRQGCDNPEDSEGPSLRNVKTHVILEVERMVDFDCDHFLIEAANVEPAIEETLPW